MLIKYIYLFLIAGSILEKGFAADSDGKDFVFSFVKDYWLRLSGTTTTAVIVIPSYNDSVCSFKYIKNSDNKVFTIQERALYGKTNVFNLNTSEVIVETSYYRDKFYAFVTKDFRIFVSCTEEVKLIGKVADSYNAWGDQFLIPSLKNAATQYNFEMPTSGSEVKGTIGILPVLKEESISINIVGYANGALFSNETISYAITFGQSQTYISISFDKVSTDVSIAITTSSPVMLSVESPYTVTSNDVESVDIEDFVQFMPIASQPSPCHSFLKHADQRMITNDFTTRLHVSQNLYCDTILNITVYKDNSAGIKQVVDKMGFTKISLMDSKVAGFSTNEGEISTNRFGSILESGVTCGHFMHYVPSTREWLTKKTQFYTLARGCVLEFYADSDGSNTDFIKIDGHKMDTFKYSRKLIPFFDKQYTQFVVTINGYGLHTIENDGNYVAYVICKNVNGPYSADGYLAGFNQWKSK